MSPESLSEAVASMALRGLEEGLFAGVVVRAERGGEILLEQAFGNALDCDAGRLPMTADTKFDVASLTKLFTTTAVLRLVTEGRLQLDATLADLSGTREGAEGRPAVSEIFRAITVRDLLTHASGLHYWYPFYAEGDTDFYDVLEKVVRRFSRRNETIYSDLNFMLLGKIVAAASGSSLEEAMLGLVCRPLGLADSAYRPKAGPFAATEFGNGIEMKMVEDLGLSFGGWRKLGSPIVGEPDDGNCHYFFGDVAGHAGVFSTAADLCRLGATYLGFPKAAGYLASGLVDEAARDHGGSRGLGFQLGELYPFGGFGHTGFTGAYLYLNRPGRLAVVILANRLHVGSPKNINEFRKMISLTVASG